MKYFATRISENMARTPEGFLLCLAVPIARTGVMDYTEEELEGSEIEGDNNGLVKMARDAKEVFRAETIASFEGKPFTINHPEGLVTPETWTRLANGVVKNVRRGVGQNATDLVADILVTTPEAIDLIESGGMREVSCGYEADYEATGIGAGRQTNIIGNHLALVEQGRAGSAYAIKDHKKEKPMNKFQKLFKDLLGIDLTKEQSAAVKAALADGDGAGKETVTDDGKTPVWADAMLQALKDLNTSVSNMAQPTVMGDEDDPDKAAKEKAAKDKAAADADPMKKVMDALEALGKRMDALEGKETDDEDVEDEDVEDEESEEDVVSEDEDTYDEGEAAPEVISDAISRAEILAPGLELEDGEKGIAAKALKHAYATKDGKRIIEALNGGKKPVWTDKKTVDHLFVAASEVMKAKRTRKNAKTKFADKTLIDGTPASKVMTAEKMNELNAKHYAKAHTH